ncbi:MAG: hypothetical protein OEZ19_06395 [Paracoccaceae bacterium]|nr:hypothetical protein [Paracoccaceae bacterium]
MPLDRFVLILVIVIAGAGVTVWVGSLVFAALQIPYVGWLVGLPVVLIAYVLWRVIAERLNNPEDDHYDQIDQ